MGLPDDYVDRSLALLRSVTPESATAAYASLVRPDDLSLVVVGDAEHLAEPLRAAGFADLEVVTLTARVGAAEVYLEVTCHRGRDVHRCEAPSHIRRL